MVGAVPEVAPYAMAPEAVLASVGSRGTGLTAEEAARRRGKVRAARQRPRWVEVLRELGALEVTYATAASPTIPSATAVAANAPDAITQTLEERDQRERADACWSPSPTLPTLALDPEQQPDAECDEQADRRIAHRSHRRRAAGFVICGAAQCGRELNAPCRPLVRHCPLPDASLARVRRAERPRRLLSIGPAAGMSRARRGGGKRCREPAGRFGRGHGSRR